MKLLDINGNLKKRNVEKYRIKWDEKSRSKIQFETKQFLKQFWFSHIVYEEFPVFGTKMKVDIINFTKKIAIEVQGNQHNTFNPFFHDNRLYNWRQSIKRDMVKLEWLELNEITVIEILEDEIKLLSKDFFKNRFDVEL